MGKPTGFVRQTSANFPLIARPPSDAKDWKEFHSHMEERKTPQSGRALHELRRAVLPYGQTHQRHAAAGCPINNLIPEWNDPIDRRPPGNEALEPSPQDEQLPRVHRPRAARPGGRRLLRPRHQQPARHDQEHRAPDHSTAVGMRVGSSPSNRRSATGKKVAVIGTRPLPALRRRAA